MKLTHQLWIPSKQRYVGFSPFTTLHQMQLAKSIELDQTDVSIDFEYAFAHMVTELSNGVIDGLYINVYDRVAIAFQLGVMHVGDMNEVKHSCNVCKSEEGDPVITTIKYALSSLLGKMQPVIDKDPSVFIADERGKAIVHLDVSPTSNVIRTLDFQSCVNDVTTVAAFNWVRSLSVNGQAIEFDKFTYEQTLELFNHIPVTLLVKIRQYIEQQQKDLPTLLTLKCGQCGGNVREIKFSFAEANSLISAALGLNLDNIYHNIYEISSMHIANVDQMTPIERSVYSKINQAYQQRKANG